MPCPPAERIRNEFAGHLPHAHISAPSPGGPSGAQSVGRAGRSVPGSARRLVIPLRDAPKGLGTASPPASSQPRGMRWPACGLPVRIASFRNGRDGFQGVTGSVRSAPAKVEKQVKSWIRFQYMQQRTDEQARARLPAFSMTLLNASTPGYSTCLSPPLPPQLPRVPAR